MQQGQPLAQASQPSFLPTSTAATPPAAGGSAVPMAPATSAQNGPQPGTTGASRQRLMTSLNGQGRDQAAALDGTAFRQPNGTAARKPAGSWMEGSADDGQQIEEPFFTVSDRRVRKSTEPVSVYRMCREWVQNDPDLEPGPLPAPTAPPALPEPLPAQPSSARPPVETPLFDDGTLFQEESTCPVEMLLEHHKEHWAKVRRFHKAERDRDMERFEHRLTALVPFMHHPGDASEDGSSGGIPMEL